MPTITINDDNLSIATVKECVEMLDHISPENDKDKKLDIIATRQIRNIDPMLFAYLMIYHEKIKGLQVHIELRQNSLSSEGKDIIYQLFQYSTYAYLITGKTIFTVEYLDKGQKAFQNFQWEKINVFPTNWFVVSESFFPIMLISEDEILFNKLFQISLKTLLSQNNRDIKRLERGINWISNSESMRNNYHAFYRSNSYPSEPGNAIINLACMHFVSALHNSKIAHLYFENTPNTTTRAGNLSHEDTMAYYKKITPIFDELLHTSIFHIFFFSTILSTEMLEDSNSGRVELSAKTEDDLIQKITNLWGFTKDLLAGVKELAKNIKEHSKPPLGAISVRLFKIKKWQDLKSAPLNETQAYQNFTTYLKKKNFSDESSILDINVVDIGQKGIISTLKTSSSDLLQKIKGKNPVFEQLISDDIAELGNSQSFGLINLLSISKHQLNQQSKRSIAHFGLLTLSKLVESNQGIISASSQNELKESGREVICMPEEINNTIKPVEIGTNFHIILPINPSESKISKLPHKITLPAETTAKDIEGLETLLDYEINEYEDSLADLIISRGIKYLINIDTDNHSLKGRQDEEKIWKEIASKISVVHNSRIPKPVICLNVRNLEIDESQLFRLLGKFELYFPNLPIIIYNLPNERYEALININEAFHEQNPRIDYWNSNIATLVYSYIDINGEQFNFSDVLYGATKEEFMQLNWHISYASMNSTAVIYKDYMLKKITKLNEDINPNTNLLFFNKNNLLPFDLLLLGVDGTSSLFEENTTLLLNNKLNSIIQ